MASWSKRPIAHPPRSNPPRRSSSGPPFPCITPSTETSVVVVSFMRSSFLSRFRARRSRPLAGEERVDLAEGFDYALFHPHLDHLFHPRAAGELGLDRHRRDAVGLGDRHRRDRRRHLLVRIALVVGEAVREAQPLRRLGLLDPPPAVVLLPVRAGHEVRGAPAG